MAVVVYLKGDLISESNSGFSCYLGHAVGTGKFCVPNSLAKCDLFRFRKCYEDKLLGDGHLDGTQGVPVGLENRETIIFLRSSKHKGIRYLSFAISV